MCRHPAGGSEYPRHRAPCGENTWHQSDPPGTQISADSHGSALNEDGDTIGKIKYDAIFFNVRTLKGLYTAAKAADYNYLILCHNKGAHQCLYSMHVYIFFVNLKMYSLHWAACADLLIMSELINDVALAFTTGTGDLAGGAASKLGSLLSLALSWSHRFTLGVSKQCHYTTHKQANKWDPYTHQAKSKIPSTKFLNTGKNAPLQCSWTCAVGWQGLSIGCWHSCLRAGNAWGLPWAHHSWYCVESFQSVTIRCRRSQMMCRTQ